METPNSSSPPQPKTTASPRDLRDTWRPSSAPPRARTSDEPPVEQRTTPRTRVRQDVQFSVGDEAAAYSGVCRNLSLGGVAIQTAEPAPFGSRVTVLIQLDGIEGQTQLGGTVRWSRPGAMGVQWDSLGALVTNAILRTAAQGD